MKNDDRPVLIITTPSNLDQSDLFDSSSSGLLLSSLLAIHKTLTRFALDWELSTINGSKVLLTQDVNSEESQNFFTNFLGKINSPRSLEDIQPDDYCGFILPSIKSFMGSLKSAALTSLLSSPLKNLLKSCKKGLVSGYGIVPFFECKEMGNWVFNSYNLASLSLIQQTLDDRFSSFSYLVEDKIRELGGNFVWSDKEAELVVLDKGIVSVQNDRSLSIGCNLFGYVLTETQN